MAARYFLVSETGDEGAWLIDTEVRSVERLEGDALEAGASVPESDFVSNLQSMRTDRNFKLTQGVSLAIAAASLSSPAGHTRREGGGE